MLSGPPFCFGNPLSTRVRFIVYLGKMLEIKVRIDLSCTDIGVAQSKLNRTEINTCL